MSTISILVPCSTSLMPLTRSCAFAASMVPTKSMILPPFGQRLLDQLAMLAAGGDIVRADVHDAVGLAAHHASTREQHGLRGHLIQDVGRVVRIDRADRHGRRRSWPEGLQGCASGQRPTSRPAHSISHVVVGQLGLPPSQVPRRAMDPEIRRHVHHERDELLVGREACRREHGAGQDGASRRHQGTSGDGLQHGVFPEQSVVAVAFNCSGDRCHLYQSNGNCKRGVTPVY